MERRFISDAQIATSSQWDINHAAVQGRLHFKAGGGKQGGWSAGANNQNQWLQVDLGVETSVKVIGTQGRNAADQWVTSYKLQYSNDGISFVNYKDPGSSADKVLTLRNILSLKLSMHNFNGTIRELEWKYCSLIG